MRDQAPRKPDTTWFTEARFGMFIHFGLYALAAQGEWVRKHRRLTDEAYQVYFDTFDPDLFDARDWAGRARDAGMKYVVLTTKHHDGFCLWDSRHTDYKITRTPYGKDLLGPFVEAFREAGLRIGFYHSLIDWHHPQFAIDRLHPQSPGQFDPPSTPADFERLNHRRDMAVYRQYLNDQVHELLTEFGAIDLLWFDFSYAEKWTRSQMLAWEISHGPGPGKGAPDWGSAELLEMVRRLQPQAMVNNRLGLPGEGDFVTPEQVQPRKPVTDEKGNPRVWEACQTFTGAWGYKRDASEWKSTAQLLWMMIDGVSKGGNLLLNVGPTGRGEIEPRVCDRLQEIGAWMRRHSRAIHQCGPAPEGLVAPPDCRYTFNPRTNRLYLHVLAWPFGELCLEGLPLKRIRHAQYLHDASQLPLRAQREVTNDTDEESAVDSTFLRLPIVRPEVQVPVVELFLR